ncbi:peptide deformylase [Legionella israelensis]|uniref:Peptide deformylase n=1 Tax=Legionella israelensis TaxID=454 RepID=A0AAX1EHZ3_9GAMM|nr:peptide deformylase [Legionella israelensis]QBR84668.1 peptide deformylase [Legionella israelensis]
MKTLLDKENPILRQQAQPVSESEYGSQELKQLVKDMIAIMEEKGAVGVAAPQIGISKQVIVYSTAYTKRRKPEHPIPDTALINPDYEVLTDEIQTGYEGCLNCGDMMGEVPRAMEIEYTGYDVNGNKVTKKASGLEARIVQHEVDHLRGFLFFDRVTDKSSLTTMSELENKVQP